MAQSYVVIHCESGKELSVIRNLRQIPQVQEAQEVDGFYEIVCKIVAKTKNELLEIINTRLPIIEHIRTKMVLSVHDMQ